MCRIHTSKEIMVQLQARKAWLSVFVCLFVCLLGKLFSSGFNPSCIFALYLLICGKENGTSE